MTRNQQPAEMVQPRHRLSSPVPTKPHIWREERPSFFGLPPSPWRCANLARSVIKFGGQGNSPSDAYSDWRQTNTGTGRHG